MPRDIVKSEEQQQGSPIRKMYMQVNGLPWSHLLYAEGQVVSRLALERCFLRRCATWLIHKMGNSSRDNTQAPDVGRQMMGPSLSLVLAAVFILDHDHEREGNKDVCDNRHESCPEKKQKKNCGVKKGFRGN